MQQGVHGLVPQELKMWSFSGPLIPRELGPLVPASIPQTWGFNTSTGDAEVWGPVKSRLSGCPVMNPRSSLFFGDDQ